MVAPPTLWVHIVAIFTRLASLAAGFMYGGVVYVLLWGAVFISVFIFSCGGLLLPLGSLPVSVLVAMAAADLIGLALVAPVMVIGWVDHTMLEVRGWAGLMVVGGGLPPAQTGHQPTKRALA